MKKLFSVGFWEGVASIILRNRIIILVIILGITVFLGMQWNNMRFTYTEANLLPDDHEINLEYNDFLDKFGEEGNLIVIGVKDSTLFSVDKLNAWNKLSDTLKTFKEVETVISIRDLQKLIRDDKNERFKLEPFIKDSL